MITYKHRIYRADLRASPEAIFVFGDNAVRIGMGGQAGHMRGEPNALGIATKRAPLMTPESFFSDSEPQDRLTVEKDLKRLMGHIEAGRSIIVPWDGIGTGLSELPQRAPMLYALIYGFFAKQESYIPIPWVKPICPA